jgi:hypothetical protein
MLAVRIGQLTAEVFHLLDLQPCWLLRRLCHLVLAFPIEREVTNSRVPSLHGRYPTSSLLRTRPPPSRLRSTSRFSRLYDLPCSGDFAPGREGFTFYSVCPCHRAVAFTPPRWKCRIGQISAPHAAFALRQWARPSLDLSRPHCVHCCYGPVTRNLPKRDLVDGLQDLWGFWTPPPSCHPNYRAPDFCPGRSVSC